jgi:lysophospholipase L1-like esterase
MAGMTLSKRTRFASWLALLALSAALTFSATEIMLRLFTGWAFAAAADSPLIASYVPGLHFQLRPNYSSDKVKTDAYGFRIRPEGPSKSRFNVLVVGDSIAFSNGLAYEKSFAPLLEQKLSVAMGEPVAVWNGGTPGYNTEQEAVQLDLAMPRIEPDLVVVQFCMNDYLDPPRLTQNGMLDATASGSSSRSLSPLTLLTASRTYILAKENFKHLEESWPEWFPQWAHYVHYLHKRPGWQRAKTALLRMQKSTQARNVELLLVVVPMEQQLRIPERAALDDLVEFARSNGILFVDLYHSFQQRWKDGLYVEYWKEAGSIDKLHLNDRGHKIAAEQIAAAILDHHRLLTKIPMPAQP